jgi:hypothetical protein
MAITARSPSLPWMSLALASGLLVAAALVSGARAAEEPDSDLVEVTPQRTSERPPAPADETEKDDWLTHAAKNAHGEVGAMIASDGSRAVYGTVTMPLGENGHLTISGATGRMQYYPYDAFGRCDYRAAPLAAAPYPLPPGAPLCAVEGGFVR